MEHGGQKILCLETLVLKIKRNQLKKFTKILKKLKRILSYNMKDFGSEEHMMIMNYI